MHGKEQCINEPEKQMRVKGNQQNHDLSRKLGCEITRGCAVFCYFCQKSKKKPNPFALEEGCTSFRTSTLQRQKDEEPLRDTCASTNN